MSKESVTEFLAKLGQDPAQEEAVKRAVEGKEDQAAAVVAAASEHGYDFTAKEFVEVIDAFRRHEQGELNEEELAKVAGGALVKPGAEATGGFRIRRDLDLLGLRY